MGARSVTRTAVVVLVVVIGLVGAACTSGDDEGDGDDGGSDSGDALATLDVIDERIDVRTADTEDFEPGSTGMGLDEGDSIRSNDTGFGELGYFDGSWMRIEARATLTIEELSDVEDASVVETSIDGGRLWTRAEKLTGSEDRFEVDTPVATASVRGTRFSIDCTVGWSDYEGATGDDPELACEFIVIEGVVVVTLPDGTEIELEAAQRLVVPDDDRDPIGPDDLIPDELYESPWVQKNLGVDAEKPDADELIGDEESQSAIGAATLDRDWEVEVDVVSSTDPRYAVGSTGDGFWQITTDCDDGDCTSQRRVVDANGAPALRDGAGQPVVDDIAPDGDGRYRFSAQWNEPCERDGTVLAPEGLTVERRSTYQVTEVDFVDGRFVATQLEGEVTTTTSLNDADAPQAVHCPTTSAPSASRPRWSPRRDDPPGA